MFCTLWTHSQVMSWYAHFWRVHESAEVRVPVFLQRLAEFQDNVVEGRTQVKVHREIPDPEPAEEFQTTTKWTKKLIFWGIWELKREIREDLLYRTQKIVTWGRNRAVIGTWQCHSLDSPWCACILLCHMDAVLRFFCTWINCQGNLKPLWARIRERWAEQKALDFERHLCQACQGCSLQTSVTGG